MYTKEMITFRQHRLIPIILLLLVIVTGALGILIQAPKNSVVLEGRKTVFTCCSNETSWLHWKHKSVWSRSISEINDISGLVNGFLAKGRFNVTRSSSPDCYSLIITDVKQEDAGTYICTDNGGLGQSTEWELVILEFLKCQETHRKEGYMGVNNFGLAQDVIAIMCISTYSGNMPAEPICEWSSGTELYNGYQYVTETKVSMTLNIQMPATKEMNNGQLHCYVQIEMESSENQNPTTWKSTPFRINYAVFQNKTVQHCVGDELSMDCFPPCNTSEFSNGSQFCEIGYPSHTDKKFYILLQDHNEPIKENGLLIVIVAMAVFIVSAIIAIPAVIWRLKKKLDYKTLLTRNQDYKTLLTRNQDYKTLLTGIQAFLRAEPSSATEFGDSAVSLTFGASLQGLSGSDYKTVLTRNEAFLRAEPSSATEFGDSAVSLTFGASLQGLSGSDDGQIRSTEDW